MHTLVRFPAVTVALLLRKFSNKSELRVSSADFGVGENDQLFIKEKQRPLILRA